MISRLLRAWFGDFGQEELKKFIKLGVLFGLIIGIYWSLRVLKDTLFQSMVGQTYQPYAKILSLVILFPLIIFYSGLVEKYPRQKLFYLLSGAYGVLSILFGVLMYLQLFGAEPTPYNIVGWLWYVYVESFGSLIVALFWAFTTDITTEESGKRGFSIVVMIGQIGGILSPKFFPQIPKLTDNYISYNVVVGILGLLILCIVPLVRYFMATTPKSELKGFGDKKAPKEDTPADDVHQEKVKPGFLEGLRLMVSKPYLLGIFGIISFFEIIVTVFDYHFKTMARAQLVDDAKVGAYLGDYGFYANLITFLCLLFGISNITRRLGVTIALCCMPVIISGAIGMMLYSTTLNPITALTIMFWIMVGAKGVNYSLNGPAMKQLYVPVSDDARYKSQAWIETFGSRGSKAAGSVLNMGHAPLVKGLNSASALPGSLTKGWASKFKDLKGLLYGASDIGSFYHIMFTSFLFFGVCGVWLLVAIYLGRTYQNAVNKKKLVV
jgi:AAA family ATP:ADP antiporter